tara:strand:- start:1616 stop:2611 length:996 start_codon:yes stop_codon:yes gene_type:complete
MTIYKVGESLDTTNFKLSNPVPNPGGTYFSKLTINNNEDQFYVQTPKCKTKQGIIKTGKKKYTDLLFSELNSDFVEMITKVEEKIQELIFKKHEIWFANTDLEMEDIQNSFISPVKVYKGKNYLMRANLNSIRNSIDNVVPIFNEKEVAKDLEDITTDSDIITILEILGIKFSQRYFQLEINIKQIMIMENAPMFENCLIKTKEDTIEEEDKKIQETKEEEEEEEEDKKIQESKEESNLEELDLEEVDLDLEKKEKIVNELDEFEINLDNNVSGENIELKKPDQIYMELYNNALEKAKQAKKAAIDAYLVAKNIKDTYALNIDDAEEYDLI